MRRHLREAALLLLVFSTYLTFSSSGSEVPRLPKPDPEKYPNLQVQAEEIVWIEDGRPRYSIPPPDGAGVQFLYDHTPRTQYDPYGRAYGHRGAYTPSADMQKQLFDYYWENRNALPPHYRSKIHQAFSHYKYKPPFKKEEYEAFDRSRYPNLLVGRQTGSLFLKKESERRGRLVDEPDVLIQEDGHGGLFGVRYSPVAGVNDVKRLALNFDQVEEVLAYLRETRAEASPAQQHSTDRTLARGGHFPIRLLSEGAVTTGYAERAAKLKLSPEERDRAKLESGTRGAEKPQSARNPEEAFLIRGINQLINSVSLYEYPAPVATAGRVQPDGTVFADLEAVLSPWQLKLLFEDNPYDCSHPQSNYVGYPQYENYARAKGYGAYRPHEYAEKRYAYEPINLGWLFARAYDEAVYAKLLNQGNSLQENIRNNHMGVEDGLFNNIIPAATIFTYFKDVDGALKSFIGQGASRSVLHQFQGGGRHGDGVVRDFFLSHDLRDVKGPQRNVDTTDISRIPENADFDAGELIYSLPNGLEAFQLFAGNVVAKDAGKRAPDAPANIVVHRYHSDPGVFFSEGMKSARANQVTIATPVNCKQCHASGTLAMRTGKGTEDIKNILNRNFRVEDGQENKVFFNLLRLVRDHQGNVVRNSDGSAQVLSIQNPEILKQIQGVYKTHAEYKSLSDDHNKRFRRALASAGGSIPNPNNPSAEAPVIPDIFYAYYDALTYKQAGLELGISEDLIRKILRDDRGPLRTFLGLNPNKFEEGKTIERKKFEQFFCLLKLVIQQDPEVAAFQREERRQAKGPIDESRSRAKGQSGRSLDEIGHGKGIPPTSPFDRASLGQTKDSGKNTSTAGEPKDKLPSKHVREEKNGRAVDDKEKSDPRKYATTNACSKCHNSEASRRKLKFDPEIWENWEKAFSDRNTSDEARKRLSESIEYLEDGSMPLSGADTSNDFSEEKKRNLIRFLKSVESEFTPTSETKNQNTGRYSQ